ncbi:ADP-ribosylation factor-like 2-binding protein, partial [Globomyces pollinis-pini]
DLKFDRIIGELEDILMDEDFLDYQRDYFGKHCSLFANDEENKLEYMNIFEEYTNHVEAYIANKLKSRIEDFSMMEFMQILSERNPEELEGDVFELLESLGDFAVFKDIMLSYKDLAQGSDMDLSGLLSVVSRP